MYLSYLLFFNCLAITLCDFNEERPAIYELTKGTKLVEGKKFFLTCLLSSGDQVTFDWFLNDQRVLPNENVYINMHEDSSMLNIRSMNLDYSGEYKCSVSNRYGKDDRTVLVSLDGKFSFY